MSETDRLQHVTKGDNFTESLSAGTWNAFIDAANFVSTGRGAERTTPEQYNDRPPLVDLIVSAQTSRHDIVGLDGIGIEFANRDEVIGDIYRPDFEGVTPTTSHRGKFAISLEEGLANDVLIGAAMGVYCCRLFVPTNGDWIIWADVDPNDSTQLRAVPNGSAQILWQESGTNTTVDAIVRLGNVSYREFPAKVITSAISADSSTGKLEFYQGGSATGYQIGTGSTGLTEAVYLDWMHGDEQISVGKEVLLGWFPSESRWRIVAAECEA